MRRDMELVRKILIEISEGKYKMDIKLNSDENRLYYYHLEIMRDAGLISFRDSGYKGGVLISNDPKLTWLGNDYLDSISNEGVWSKTKNVIKERGMELSNVPFEIVSELAKMQLKKWIGME
ncbi:DUF2513 domain-containing protein [Paucisalibacillus globulus]|uniref:DUF2513 domain-containing protein n=1 Tax=Paucisalibacillus globulus TaxID=351095 RepID=UPI000BB7EAAC|nr:DUF2513 domain-containing protein [Paucisalibacillus globulus]